jgi:hypothetical protein
MGFDHLYDLIRRACPPPEWSKGVQLARAGAVIGESAAEDEIELKVSAALGMMSLPVSLYPEDDEWSCGCSSRAPACEHVAAAVIAVKQARERGDALPRPSEDTGMLRYVLERSERGLLLDRVVVTEAGGAPLRVLLTSAAAGKAEVIPVAFEAVDLEIERLLDFRVRGRIPREHAPALLKLMAGCREVRLGERAVKTSGLPIGPFVVVEDQGDGFRVEAHPDPRIDEVFTNGILRLGDALHPVADVQVSHGSFGDLARGRLFRGPEVAELVTRVLPELRRQVRVEVRTRRLPTLAPEEPPRVIVTARAEGQALWVEGSIVYGDPMLARVEGDLLSVVGDRVPVRDEAEERRLAEELRRELGLFPGVAARLEAEEAVAFGLRLRRWRGQVAGSGLEAFAMRPPLEPQLELQGDDFELRFRSEDRPADVRQVLAAWRGGGSLCPLEDGGGWAAIPTGWLQRFGPILADLFDAREAAGKLPKAALPDLARLAEAMGAPPPPGLARLGALVEGFEGLGEPALPLDLRAELRPYQRRGVAWLGFLRAAGLGGLLADDMGLGKTLQAACVLAGRSLVVAPTSVLWGWKAELAKFRPGLRVSLYHGPGRALDPSADVTITSYALLRLDQEVLARVEWATLVLDESQAVKNPSSQVAQAAFALRAGFRVALTGTPVENRLDELWSQLHFVARGLLGTRQAFEERVARPIAAGEAGATSRLAQRIRPFVLRRTKAEVAPDLPPRTEVVLHVVLDDQERVVYDALRAATRKDVLERVGAGASVMEVLEALLRLRQAACHRALVPGQRAQGSSKLSVLLEALDEAIAEGHKALVFSQWTSLLDLLEPPLRAAGHAFVRLDGSTRDRAGVVDRFQRADGPPVMLLSLKAGGTGLNLTRADHVFLLDPWWNPAVEDQAADRAHRIGQDRPVLIHRLVARDTVEERILALQESKRALADAALSGAGRAAALTREDLLGLIGD